MGLMSHALVGLGCLAVGFGGGYKLRSLQADHDALKAAQAATKAAQVVVAHTAAAAAITQDVGVKVEAAQERVRTVTQTITKEIPVYVTVQADHGCIVPRGFVSVHDAAARGILAPALPDSASGAVDAPSGVALSTVASVVAENYGQCHAEAERLKGWQDWYATQRKAWDAP